jgi:hypothetical protein
MDDTTKIATSDELVEWLDKFLDEEIAFLLIWAEGDGYQKPPASIAKAMHNRANRLQQERRRIRHGDEQAQQHKL